MIGSRLGLGILPLWFAVIGAPLAAAAPIDLSQLCGAGNCVVSTSQTIGSASGPLEVGGNFTVDPGVVLEFLVPVTIRVDGNMVLSGTVGAPGNGGDGGSGGAAGQPGGAGGDAPSVVSGIFDVRGSITINANAAAVAEGGAGGSGGDGGLGQVGGAGGAGGAAGSLTFNTCRRFTSQATSQILVNGGPGGVGQAGASGGAGGAAGTVTVNAGQDITSNAAVRALGGAGGSGGAGAGGNGASGFIALTASGTITVGTGTLDSGANTPSISQSQDSIPALAYCSASAVSIPSIPSLSEWGLILLTLLMAMSGMWSLHQRLGARSKSGSDISTGAPK